MQIKSLTPELMQAFWRIALAGNPHWVRYYATNAPRGTNTIQCSEGHITSTGRDRTDRAGRPFCYTSPFVDAKKLGFGFWSRSDQGEATTYRFADWDIEPKANGRVNRQPSNKDKSRSQLESLRVYKAIHEIAEHDHRIIWQMLVESSEAHYHVWVLFANPLMPSEHDVFVRQVNAIAGPFQNLDKDTSVAGGRFGTQFRAPWSWKRGVRSETLLDKKYRSNEELIELGESLKVRLPRTFQVRPHDSTSSQLQRLLECYPIEEPGQRNAMQGRWVASMVSRGFSEHQILTVGDEWLRRFEPVYQETLEAAQKKLRDCVQRTLANPKFSERKAVTDYCQLYRDAVLTDREQSLETAKLIISAGAQKCLVDSSGQSLAHSTMPPYQPLLEEGECGPVSSHSLISPVSHAVSSLGSPVVFLGSSCSLSGITGDREEVGMDGRGEVGRGLSRHESLDHQDHQQVSKEEFGFLPARPSNLVQQNLDREEVGTSGVRRSSREEFGSSSSEVRALCRGVHDWKYLEALILHVRQKRSEGQTGLIKMTDQQIADIIKARHGIDLSERKTRSLLKAKYVTRLKGTLLVRAEVFEFLRCVKSGKPGFPSEYEVTGLAAILEELDATRNISAA